MFLGLLEGRVKTPKKGLLGPFRAFWGPYGGIPKVFGRGPIEDLRRKEEGQREEKESEGG